jgi:cysteine-S-conjugate beta-lyase
MSQIEPFQIEQLRSLSGVKWSRHGPDVLPAWVADMDIAAPRCVIDALQGLVTRSDFGYNRQALAQLPEVFARWQQTQHGWSLDPEEIRVFCDVLHAIDLALWLLTEPGDGVVLLTPIYPPFLAALDTTGRRLIDVPLDPDGWRLDPERLASAIDDRTRAILLCNPHNPTGRVFDEAELGAIAQVAVEHDLVVLSDEVWADLVYAGATHRPMASLGPEVAARTVTISAASKAFNLAGLRCAVAHIGHRALAERIQRLPSHLLGAVGTPGAEAAVAAWTEGKPWLTNLLVHLDERRAQLGRRLTADLPGVGFAPPEATYLSWLDFRPLGLGQNPADKLLGSAQVALSPGPDFGVHGEGFARLNFATSASILDEILDRLASATS